MSTDNTTDRLLTDARKKTASEESPTLGKVAFIVGIIALVTSLFPPAGWALGAVALGLGFAASRRPVTAKQGRTAMILGVAAILVGVFSYTLTIALFF